jgi:hypothetical protein
LKHFSIMKIKIIGFYIQIVFCVHKNALFQRKISLILFLRDLGEHRMRMRNFGDQNFCSSGMRNENLMRTPGNGDPGVPIANPTQDTDVYVTLLTSKRQTKLQDLYVQVGMAPLRLFCLVSH